MALDGSQPGLSNPDGGDKDQLDGLGEEEDRRRFIFNKLKGNEQNIFFEGSQEIYTLGYLYKNRLMLHAIPWRTCAPDPSLVQKQFTNVSSRGAITGNLRAVSDLVSSMRVMEHGAGRPVTDDELAAMSYYTARKLQTFDMYFRGGAIVGTMLWWRKRTTFKLPGWWAPKDLSRFNVFPHRRLPLATGRNAQYLWYAHRVTLYTFLGTIFGGFFGVSNGARALGEGLRHDPRTQDLVNTYKKEMMERRARGETLAGQIGQLAPKARVTMGSDAPRSMDEGPSFDGQFDTQTVSASTETSRHSDSGLRTRSQSQQFQSPGTSHRQDPSATENTRDEPYDFSIDSISKQYSWDDASPTAGNEATSTPTQPSSSGSAWDRLRNSTLSAQKGSGSSSSPSESSSIESSWEQVRGMSSPRGDEETSGNSYSYSPAEEEKSLAKEQAQKDFDEMLERERQGNDPNSGSGGSSGGWSRP